MTNVNIPGNIRPTLKAATDAIENEHREGKAHGLMQDAFMEAVRIRFNGVYSTGLEEREATKRIERVMSDYFNAKKNPQHALSFVTPEHLRKLIDTMTQAEVESDERASN